MVINKRRYGKRYESKIHEIIQTILNSISNVSEYRFFFNNIENMYVRKIQMEIIAVY